MITSKFWSTCAHTLSVMLEYICNQFILKVMERWAGKVAVVTGAGAGIGEEIAVRLANAGLIVIGLEFNKHNIEKLKTKKIQPPGQLHTYECDITDEQVVKTAFEWIAAKLGGVNILINNAGEVYISSILGNDNSLQLIKRTIDTNLTAVITCTKEAFNILKKTDDIGHIINICSGYGHEVPFVHGSIIPWNIYPGTKYAIRATTEVLRQELIHLGKKVKISQISPGFVNTDMLKTILSNAIELPDPLPLLNVRDIADAILYIIGTPAHVQVHDLIIRPVGEQT